MLKLTIDGYYRAYERMMDEAKQKGKPSMLLYYVRDVMAAEVARGGEHARVKQGMIEDIDRLVEKLRRR